LIDGVGVRRDEGVLRARNGRGIEDLRKERVGKERNGYKTPSCTGSLYSSNS
jgi:hypothetical protein